MGKKSTPKAPEEDPEVKRRREEEQRRAEAERDKEIQENLRTETVTSSTSAGTRKSLFSKGRGGFQLRSLLGGK